MERRLFSRAERNALYANSGGRCESCGRVLEPHWHGDHVHPSTHGGTTDVANGQALCPECNLRKGARLPELHQWQQRAIRKHAARTRPDFLVEAVVGAGKTRLAIELAKIALASSRTDFVVVICPSNQLCRQWADALDRAGIKARPQPTVWPVPADVKAVTLTYQAVAQTQGDIIRMQCARLRVFAVLDELHHCGDESMWGSRLRHALEGAVDRLGLTGTPFRGSPDRIPFVTYREGVAQPDEYYGYTDALRDKVVRRVVFPRQGGHAEWVTPQGYRRDVPISDDTLVKDEWNQRLRTVISADGDWLRGTLYDANGAVSEYRRTDPDAAGLVLADSVEHAERVARVLTKVAGEPAVVVHSQDGAEARDRLEAFGSGTHRWLVSVRMVSEGVDIPRLRVGVFATVTMTELFFRQVVGRIVRPRDRRGFSDREAKFFIPDDPRLRKFAEDFRVQRLDAEECEPEPRESSGENGDQSSLFTPLGSSRESQGSIASDGTIYALNELRRAEIIQQSGDRTAQMSAEQIIDVLRAADLVPRISEGPAAEPVDGWREDQRKREKIAKYVKRLVPRLEGPAHADVHVALNRLTGTQSIAAATSHQLDRQLAILGRWLSNPSVYGRER